MSLASNLTKLMEYKGIQAKELSSISGVPESRISEIVSGKTKNPQFKTLHKIANALGTSLEVLTGEGEMREIPVVREPSAEYEKSPVDDYGAKVLAIAGQVISIGTEDERRQKIQAIADLVADMMKSKT